MTGATSDLLLSKHGWCGQVAHIMWEVHRQPRAAHTHGPCTGGHTKEWSISTVDMSPGVMMRDTEEAWPYNEVWEGGFPWRGDAWADSRGIRKWRQAFRGQKGSKADIWGQWWLDAELEGVGLQVQPLCFRPCLVLSTIWMHSGGGGGEINGVQQCRQVGAGLDRTVTADRHGVNVCTLRPKLFATCTRSLPLDCGPLGHRVSAGRWR